jgi:OmpA-OmpF porin, OOP family
MSREIARNGFKREHDARPVRIKIDAHEPSLLVFPSDALFDFDKSSLRGDAIGTLRELAAVIQKKNITKATIEGHTDSTGSKDYNIRLSKARAEAIRDWLILNGVFQAAFFAVEAKGESSPIASNVTSSGRQRNRRVAVRYF